MDKATVRELKAIKQAKLQEIAQAIQAGGPLRTESRYHVSLPTNAAHEKTHLTGKAAGMTQRVDPLVSQIVEEIVREGTTDVDTVRKLLKCRIKQEVRDCPPDALDRAYNPSKDDIRNHVNAARRAIELSKFDQENFQAKVKEWQKTTAKHFFRPFIKKDDNVANETAETEQLSQTLLWVHQERWQQTLLQKYGNAISLIDATYKTTKYDLPLFFVCVRTNVGYCVAAEFVIQGKTTQHILEALNILRSWNAGWNPPFFLCDYSEAEISALEQAFPGVMVYICDFHREQAWVRWVRNHKNGLTREQGENLLQLLRECAWAEGGDTGNRDALYQLAVQRLKASMEWKLESVQGWLNTTWLCIPRVQLCAEVGDNVTEYF